MKETQISKGDKVRVDFNNTQSTLCRDAEVLHIPQHLGDSWVFRERIDFNEYELYDVSEGCTITLIEKKLLK